MTRQLCSIEYCHQNIVSSRGFSHVFHLNVIVKCCSHLFNVQLFFRNGVKIQLRAKVKPVHKDLADPQVNTTKRFSYNLSKRVVVNYR